MHQFLNQLLAKREQGTGLPCSQLAAEPATRAVSRRKEACPTYLSFKSNWEHWKHKGLHWKSTRWP